MKKLYISLILLVISITVFSQSRNLTLQDAIQTGLENNYQILISEKNVEVAKNNNTWGTAGLYPTITAGVTNSNRFDSSDSQGESTTKTVMPTVGLRWTLFNGMNVHLTKKNLTAIEKISDLSAQSTIENTIQDITLAYYNCLLQRERLEIVNEIQKLSKDRYDYMLARKEFGSAATYEVLQSKNSYLSDSSTYLQQLNLYESSIRNINLLLAEKEKIDYKLLDEFSVIRMKITISHMWQD